VANIRTLDMKFLDDLFEMNDGYVLDFVDRTMLSFFAEELNVDIDDPAYREQGSSKARRLRCYLNKVDLAASVAALQALWAYREAYRSRKGREEWVENAEGRFFSLLGRMQGMPGAGPAEPPKLAFHRPKLLALKQRLKDMWNMDPHQRGYAFEQWLREAFNLYGLAPREPFRNRGEQIDGSFALQGETYLLEAKWQAALTPAADLHALEGKLAQKAVWARGLFVSYTGFTEDGLHAFGRGKRVICMDGEDFHDALERELPLDHVLARKVRAAAETGLPFQRVRDLFAR
jgi:hypothetical protein